MSASLVTARRASGAAAKTRSRVGAEPLAATPVAPATPQGLVSRPALVARLAGAHDAVLALLVAPPGYGKSSLLAEWSLRDARPFEWLRLGADDADPDAMAMLAAKTTRGTTNAVSALMRTVTARHDAFVLVIDDAHAFAPEVLRRVVEPMLKLLPSGSTIAVASRTELPLPVGRLRAHRAIVEIRMADFAMNAADAGSVLHGAGAHCEFAEIQAITRRTEGWPAALYLSALDDGPHLLDEYVSEEILAGLGPSLTNFALRTAVLEELTGESCDAVLKEANSARKLAKLARATALLEPLDPAHERFRWHTLAREALLAELRRVERPLEARLHVRASDHYARAGDPERAIEHAVAARNVKRAGVLLWARLPYLCGTGRLADVSAWLARLGDAAVAGSPELALCAAHVALGQGDAVRAQYLALFAEGALDQTVAGAGLESLATGLAIVEAAAARGGATGMEHAAARADAALPVDSPWRPSVCYLRGTAAYLRGAAAEAETFLDDGATSGLVPAPAVAALCLAQGAMLALEQEDWDAAEELGDRAREVAAEHALLSCPTSALVLAAAAAARARHGRADEAKRDLRLAAELMAHLGEYPSWYGAETRVLMAHASLWLADVTAARALLSEASRQARKVPDAPVFERWFDRAWGLIDSLAEQSLAGPSTLTIAELRILRFLPSHRSFREIAAQLGVSANTVKTQAHAVYRKLGVSSRSEAVARATETGLLG